MSTGTRAGFFESAVQKLFMRRAQVDAVDDLNAQFRMITLAGEGLKGVDWTPGDKIQIQLGSWRNRTYTPLQWDPIEGRTRVLVYLHADGPGTVWAREVRAGDLCLLFGPRKSIDLRRLEPPAVLFGDETSIGLAAALQATGDTHGIELLFEFSSPHESVQVIDALGLSKAHHCVRSDDGLAADLERRLLSLVDAHHPVRFAITGKSTSIQQVRQLLRARGFSAAQFQSKAYWAPGKTGLD
jgi:ferric-chelate reductase (NADPH)